MQLTRFLRYGAASGVLAALFLGCSASGNVGTQRGDNSGGTGGTGTTDFCGSCFGPTYTSCESGSPQTIECGAFCIPDFGCSDCSPQGTMCVGNNVHGCSDDGVQGDLIEACDLEAGEMCNDGRCQNGCAIAADQPSNVGCEFYAVDLDLADGLTNPGAGPWAVALANAGQTKARVVIEVTDSPYGQPPTPTAIHETTIDPGQLEEFHMPQRTVDCGNGTDDPYAPGSCLSRAAFRITSTSPIVVYQFNNISHSFSTDASLLLPTTAIGKSYRVVGWPAAHSYPTPLGPAERAYVTVVGTKPNTKVTVKPSWRIRGNGPIPATQAGETLEVTIGPFDVLNLETDDATLAECVAMTSPPYCSDLTGTAVEATEPVVVFSGTEGSGIGLPNDAELPPSWQNLDEGETKGCCIQHLEEQLTPVESYGKRFLITRSPIRSNGQFTKWVEPDRLRFVGAAEPAVVTTNLEPPHDSFTLEPGEIVDTYTRDDIVVDSTQPIVVAQFLLAQDYVEPTPKGDPSFTIFPPVEQARTEYVILSPSEWAENWIVIGAEEGTTVTIDGAEPTDCTSHDVGMLAGKSYVARRCKVATGVHNLSGDGPFQIMAYGYHSADAYSFAGGADLKRIYQPPPLF